MKVGDMVQYTHHADWANGGLGIVVGVNTHQQYHIAWLDDIEDFGWTEALDSKAAWYGPEDFEKDIQLVVEAS